MPDATTNDDTADDDVGARPASRAMDRALALAAAARRRTAPNPWVGCVLVRDGVVVGEGATQPPGGAHAEIEALHAAGDRAARRDRGTSRSSPARITAVPVRVPMRSSPRACGGSSSRSKTPTGASPAPASTGCGTAGIAVEVGEGAACRDRCCSRRTCTTGAPAGRTSWPSSASSLDGRVAAADGTSQWITSADARVDAHELRADSQAIVIGSGTALADHPALTVRGVELPAAAIAPLRVVLDGRGRVPAVGPAVRHVRSRRRSSSPPNSADPAERRRVERGGRQGRRRSAPGADGGVDLDEATTVLAREGVLQALVEGGGTLLGAVLSEGAARRASSRTSHRSCSAKRAGPATRSPVRRHARPRSRAHELVDVTRFGPDVRLTYEVG